MARDRSGRRRLSEVGVLRRGEGGRVEVVSCWHCERGFGSGADALRDMVRLRGVS